MAELQKNNDIPAGIKIEDLQAVGEALPRGAITRIAEKLEVTHTYVSRFFKGEYKISADNIKILDEAKKEIKSRGAQNNLNASANKKIAEILSINTDSNAD